MHSIGNNNSLAEMESMPESITLLGNNTVECKIIYDDIPIFSESVLDKLLEGAYYISGSKENNLSHLVFTSTHENIFSLGGDLKYFASCIKNRRRKELQSYMDKCLDCIHLISSGFGKGINTVSVVSGKAFGGGFEAALASNYIIAEEGSSFGFPEILFNMFPGMGAHILLSKRIGFAKAEKIIESGDIIGAEIMLEAGVIDEIVPYGQGMKAALKSIEQDNKNSIAKKSLHQVREALNPVLMADLKKVGDIWVENAFALSDRDIRFMERLAGSQDIFI